MALATYSDLKTAIADHLDRSNLTSNINDFIDLAEERHKNEIRFRDMLTRSSISISARQISYPAGFLEAEVLRILTNPVQQLRQVTLDDMGQLRTESTGKPAYFTTHAEIEFDITPDQAYSGEIIYYKEMTPLDATNTTNALLTRSPSCYLYAALSASAPFLLDDERIQVWETFYQNAKNGLNRSAIKGKRIGAIIPRIVGATP